MSTVTASRGSRASALLVVLSIVIAVAVAAVVAWALNSEAPLDVVAPAAPSAENARSEQYLHDSQAQRDYVEGLIGRSQSTTP